MSQPNDERVLVVPADEFDRLGRFQGFSPEADRYLEALLAPGLAGFRPRSEVEDDPSLKQIIPYVVFRSGDRVFCYTRGGGGGEARLRRRRSLGVGGHVAEADADGRGTPDAYEMALRRELDEEVAVGSPGVLTRVGLINDDATPVGRVHLGVVHLFELDRPEVAPREADIAEAGFVAVDRLRDDWDAFESWSQVCIGGVPRTPGLTRRTVGAFKVCANPRGFQKKIRPLRPGAGPRGYERREQRPRPTTPLDGSRPLFRRSRTRPGAPTPGVDDARPSPPGPGVVVFGPGRTRQGRAAASGGGAGVGGFWGDAEAWGWRASSQSIRGGKISSGA